MLPFLLSLMLAGMGLYGLLYAVNAYRRHCYVVDTPTSTVQAVAMGLAEVQGRAVPAEETITSPFAEQPCLLCHYVCVYPRSEGTAFEAGTLGVPFYLEDDTGRLLVRPQGAAIRIPQHLTRLSSQFGAGVGDEHAPPATVQRFLKRKREGTLPELPSGRAELLEFLTDQVGMTSSAPTGAPAGGTPRFVEARLEPGDAAYVLGTAQSRASATVPAGATDRNEANLFIGAAPNSQGPFWSSYASVFEIASGSAEDLVDQSRREVRWQIGQGLLLFGAGLGCLALVLTQGCG